jgi:hypothetical protein
MGTLRFADLQSRPTEVLDVTSLTVDECQQLVPPFEATFQAIWPTGVSMDDRSPPVGRRPIRTVRCPRQRIGGCVSWSH